MKAVNFAETTVTFNAISRDTFTLHMKKERKVVVRSATFSGGKLTDNFQL
jgi:hypothetical protein